MIHDSRHGWHGERPDNGKHVASRASDRPWRCPNADSHRTSEPMRPDAATRELLDLIAWQRVAIEFLAADRNRLAGLVAELVCRKGAA